MRKDMMEMKFVSSVAVGVKEDDEVAMDINAKPSEILSFVTMLLDDLEEESGGMLSVDTMCDWIKGAVVSEREGK